MLCFVALDDLRSMLGGKGEKVGEAAGRPTHGRLWHLGVAVLTAAAILIAFQRVAPASADVANYVDPVSDGTVPTMDIVAFTATVTTEVVGVHIDFVNYDPAITGQAAVWAEVDLNGDDVNEYTFKRRPVDGSFWVYRGDRSSTVVACAAGSSPAGPSGIEMLAPASCLGNPTRARFGVYATNALYGYDYAGYWTPWLSPSSSDPTMTAPWPYVTPSPTPSPTPTPSQDPTSTPTAPLEPSSTSANGSAVSGLRIVRVCWNPAGRDTARNADAEWVRLQNKSSRRAQIRGWTLRDRQGHVFRFPAVAVPARSRLTVHTGRGKATATHLYWARQRHVWDNGGDTALLRSANGRRVDVVRWARPVTGCGSF